MKHGQPIAALPMYDFPDLTPQTDALWARIGKSLHAAGIPAVPQFLTRGRGHFDIWRDPKLLIGQACEYPLALGLPGAVQLVATPCYSAQGCAGATYRSAIVVRHDQAADTLADLRGLRCVVNEQTSNSGMNLLRAAVAPLAEGRSFFQSVAVSGSHRRSAEMVAVAQADVAAIDCVTWAHLHRCAPGLILTLRVLGWTEDSPSLPFVTSRETPLNVVSALRKALADTIEDPDLSDTRRALLLTGFEFAPDQKFERVLQLAEYADRLGYPTLT